MPDGLLPATAGPDKVKVGFFSFTEVTDPSEHRAYNEWHQLDHMPEQFPLPGVAWGQRWVSTPACRAARAVDGALLAPVHYLTLYLMTEPVDETLEAFAVLGRRLRELGRFHEHRRSHLSGPFDRVGTGAATRVLVSAAAVAYRPNTGVYVVVEEATSEAGDVLVPERDPSGLLEVPGVAGVWSFTAAGGVAGRWRPGRRRITVCYLDGDPLETALAMGPALELFRRRVPAVETIFAGPFETIRPWCWDWFDGT
ncbi:MAG: hypothetical protein ACYDD6_00330 [Acidimicrobiales bacterium]